MAKRAITLFAVDKKSKNCVSMIARTRGLKKAKKIGAAPFSLWCHPRRRRLKKRRRWFRLCAEWNRLFSLSLLLRRRKKTRVSMTMARLLSRNVRFILPQEEEGEEEEEEEEALRKEGVFSRREREREREREMKRGYLSLSSAKSMTMAMAMKKKEYFSERER